MGLIGAMFGLGFLIGPAIGGIISTYSYTAVAVAGAIAASVNLLLIIAFLPEPKKHVAVDGVELHLGKVTRLMATLFVLAFMTTVAFAPIQSISTQFYVDVFDFTAQQISYVLIVIGATSVIYQGFLIKHIRHYLKEVSMIHMGLTFMMVAFFLQAYNTSSFWLWVFLPLFPLGM